MFLLLFVPGAGLADDGPSTAAAIAGGPFPPTFQAIQDNVFTPSCALSFCHGASMQADLDLREGAAYAMIVTCPAWRSRTRTDQPYDPDNST